MRTFFYFILFRATHFVKAMMRCFCLSAKAMRLAARCVPSARCEYNHRSFGVSRNITLTKSKYNLRRKYNCKAISPQSDAILCDIKKP
ncbi:MAG TPA: hypothetical protein DHH42_00845 [Clostridiales bacterium]|nr:hypothetical protein [Clostridiales bacterium]